MATPITFEFGPFRLDTETQQLYVGQEPLVLQPKPFQLLELLLVSYPAILQKKQIMEEVWPDTYVDEGNVDVHVFALRTLFKKYSSEKFIEVRRGVGVRFLANVTRSNGVISATSSPAVTPPGSPALISSQERR